MEPLICLTPFLVSGKKFKLASGETFDSLRQQRPETASPTETPAPKGRSGKRIVPSEERS